MSNSQNKYQPERRTRPVSAGPLATSNQSAFSTPPNRSHTPNTHLTADRGKSLPPQMLNMNRSGGMSSGRTLPMRPDERPSPQGQAAGSRVAPPGRTPPRVHNDEQQPNDQPPTDPEKLKNSKWYEYGCV
jgi:hypothetical protein